MFRGVLVARRYAASILFIFAMMLLLRYPSVLEPLAAGYVRVCALFADIWPHRLVPPHVAGLIVLTAVTAAAAVTVSLLREVAGVLSLERLPVAEVSPETTGRSGILRVLDEAARVRVIDDADVYVFCAGLFRPRVFVSWGLLHALAPAELEAVLRHELHHLRRRDPFRLFVLGLVERLAVPLPLLRAALGRVRVAVELAADRAALEAVGPETLASAIVKVARLRAQVPHRVTVAGITPDEARVAALLGRPVGTQLDLRDALVSALVLSAVVAVVAHLAVQPFVMSPICNACPSF